jgi:hypothetical protein
MLGFYEGWDEKAWLLVAASHSTTAAAALGRVPRLEPGFWAHAPLQVAGLVESYSGLPRDCLERMDHYVYMLRVMGLSRQQ